MACDLVNSLKTVAAGLGKPYESFTIDELANGYCKATDENDEDKRSIYISALILRFWNKVKQIYEACKQIQGFGYEDAYAKVYDLIEVACKYRKWQDPESHTNAQACINQVISSRGIPAILYEANHLRNKVNINVSSLNYSYDNDDGNETTVLDTIQDEAEDPANDNARLVHDVIQNLINENKIVEAIIIYNIAFNDSYKVKTENVEWTEHTKEYNKETEQEEEKDIVRKGQRSTFEFWKYRVVQTIANLPESFNSDFADRYSVNEQIVSAAINSLKTTKSGKLYKFVDSTLNQTRRLLRNI